MAEKISAETLGNKFVNEFIYDQEESVMPWVFAEMLYKRIVIDLHLPSVDNYDDIHANNTLILVRALIKQLDVDKKLNRIVIAVSSVLLDIGRAVMAKENDEEDDVYKRDPQQEIDRTHALKGMDAVDKYLEEHSTRTHISYKSYDENFFNLLGAMDKNNIFEAVGRAKGKILSIIKMHSDDIKGTNLHEQIVMDANKLDRFRFGRDKVDLSKLAFDVTDDNLSMVVFIAKMLNGHR